MNARGWNQHGQTVDQFQRCQARLRAAIGVRLGQTIDKPAAAADRPAFTNAFVALPWGGLRERTARAHPGRCTHFSVAETISSENFSPKELRYSLFTTTSLPFTVETQYLPSSFPLKAAPFGSVPRMRPLWAMR